MKIVCLLSLLLVIELNVRRKRCLGDALTIRPSLFSRRVGGPTRPRRMLDLHSSTSSSLPTLLPPNTEANTWKWKGHDIHTQVTNPTGIDGASERSKNAAKPSVLLIHGFGCSTTYWRATIAALSTNGYQVHALDLLGQGKSSKPGRADGIEISINLWAELVDAYIQDCLPSDKDIVLMGNSLGSLVALSVATRDFDEGSSSSAAEVKSPRSTGERKVRGIGMFNCGVGLNSRGIANEERWAPWQRLLINTVLNILNFFIFNNLLLLGYILDKVVTKDLLKDALTNLYKVSPERVDEELVDSFYYPAKDKGSPEALSQVYTNDPGKTPMELHSMYRSLLESLPIHLVWGDDDAVTPIEGGVGTFYADLGRDNELTPQVTFQKVRSGHIPFDDNPEESNGSMLKWLGQL